MGANSGTNVSTHMKFYLSKNGSQTGLFSQRKGVKAVGSGQASNIGLCWRKELKMRKRAWCVVILAFGMVAAHAYADQSDDDFRRQQEANRIMGIVPGTVQTFEKDPQVTAEREAEFRRYMEAKDARSDYEVSRLSARGLGDTSSSENDGNPVVLLSMRIFDRIIILLNFIIAIGCLNRIRQSAFKSRWLARIAEKLQKYIFWPGKLDSIVILACVGITYLVLWFIPHAGQNGLAFFFGVVVPLSAFILSWKLMGFTFSRVATSDINKRMAVSFTVAFLLLQFGFEPWPMVTVKALICLPLCVYFLKSTSLRAYRLFLIPVIFSLIFSVTRLVGSEDFFYLFARIIFNGAILYMTLRSFIRSKEGEASGAFSWEKLIGAAKSLGRIPLPFRFGSVHSIPSPPKQWYYFINDQVSGPDLESELKKKAALNLWGLNLPICEAGSTEWITLGDIS